MRLRIGASTVNMISESLSKTESIPATPDQKQSRLPRKSSQLKD